MDGKVDARRELMRDPILQFLVTDLSIFETYRGADNLVRDIADAPDDIAVSLRNQGRRISERRDVFSNVRRFVVVQLEFNPFGLAIGRAQVRQQLGKVDLVQIAPAKKIIPRRRRPPLRASCASPRSSAHPRESRRATSGHLTTAAAAR